MGEGGKKSTKCERRKHRSGEISVGLLPDFAPGVDELKRIIVLYSIILKNDKFLLTLLFAHIY